MTFGCPHQIEEKCMKVDGRDCDPGMKGCILHGRFRFVSPTKNRAPQSVKRRLRDANRPRHKPDEPPPSAW